MPTYNLVAADLEDFANDASEIITEVESRIPIAYRVKEIVLSDLSDAVTFTRPPTVTISSAPVGGITATAASKVVKTYDASGNAHYDLELYVTNPGSGYTSLPTVTVDLTLVSSPRTITFNGSSTSVVNIVSNTITSASHSFFSGQRVVYYNGGGTAASIGGLVSESPYFIISTGTNTLQLARTYEDSVNATPIQIDITGVGQGASHTLSNNLTRIEAFAVLEVDPLVLQERQQMVESINAQIIEEAIRNDSANVKADFANVVTQLTNLTTQTGNVRIETANVKTELANIRTEISNVKTQISTSSPTATLTTIKDEIANLKSQIQLSGSNSVVELSNVRTEIRLSGSNSVAELSNVKTQIQLSGSNSVTELSNVKVVLQEIRDEFDVSLANNLASVVENIDMSINDQITREDYTLSNISGTFTLGESVTTPTGSGQVMYYDSFSKKIVLGNIFGTISNAQTLTGAESSATAKIVIVPPPTPDATNDQIARGMMMLNLKTTDTLEDLRTEIRNPTRIL